MKRNAWTDRRIMTYGLLIFSGVWVSYAFIFAPMATSESLISAGVDALITACVFSITGYTVGRIASNHKSLRGRDDDEAGG